MKYKEKLLQLADYQQLLKLLQDLEQERIYCKHDVHHFEKVEEIGHWLCEIQGLDLYDEISLVAYLHDIGRVDEYMKGISHDRASFHYASIFLQEIDFPLERRQMVLDAISKHRKREDFLTLWNHRYTMKDLTDILLFADQVSRKCYACKVAQSCKWTDVEKTKNILEEYKVHVNWQ